MNRIFKLLVPILLLAMATFGLSYAADLGQFNFGQNRLYSVNPKYVRSITANSTATVTDHLIKCDTTSGNLVVTLPPASTTVNMAGLTIQNTGTTGYTCTVTASVTDVVTNSIEGSASRIVYSPLDSASGAYLSIEPKLGYGWNVKWETNPVRANMANGLGVRFNVGAFSQTLVSALTTTVQVLTYADCGKTFVISADSTPTLPKISSPGCVISFINDGATATVVINLAPVQTGGPDSVYGYVSSTGGNYLISNATGTYVINAKATARRGDSISLVSAVTGTTHWLITRAVGTWQ